MKLQFIQNTAAHVVLDIQHQCPTQQLLCHLHWLPVHGCIKEGGYDTRELISPSLLLVVKWGQSSPWRTTYRTHCCLWLTACRDQVTNATNLQMPTWHSRWINGKTCQLLLALLLQMTMANRRPVDGIVTHDQVMPWSMAVMLGYSASAVSHTSLRTNSSLDAYMIAGRNQSQSIKMAVIAQFGNYSPAYCSADAMQWTQNGHHHWGHERSRGWALCMWTSVFPSN